MWPNSGIDTNETTEALSTATSRKSRGNFNVPTPYANTNAVKM